MSYEFKFHRGDKVKNIIEGWTGIVQGYHIPLDGMMMYGCVIPKAKDKRDYDEETIYVTVDEVSLELIEACDPSDSKYAEFPDTFEFQIGDKVKSLVAPTQSEGVITAITCYPNLCIHYRISTDASNNEGKIKSFTFPGSILTKIEDSPIKGKVSKLRTTANTTGGPSFIETREF